MTVVSSEKNAEDLTLTFIADFDAPVDRVWRVWEDPRTLERWWGPPTWPATFVTYEFVAGGCASYYMTGPDGTKAGGWWRIVEIDAPTRLVFEDDFADDDGNPLDAGDKSTIVVTLAPHDDGTRMTIVCSFADLAQLERMSEMGMREGMTLALGQVDALLVQ